jgi:hypothetical protein
MGTADHVALPLFPSAMKTAIVALGPTASIEAKNPSLSDRKRQEFNK